MTQTARKYRGPETWARIRARYLDGEPAPLLALEYDVGLDNLRRRAANEGWTRIHQQRLRGEPNVRWARPDDEPDLTRRERALHDFQTVWPEVWDEVLRFAWECANMALRDEPEICGPWATGRSAGAPRPSARTARRRTAAAPRRERRRWAARARPRLKRPRTKPETQGREGHEGEGGGVFRSHALRR